ncbi:Serine/threonine-phosphatase BSL1-like protein [Nymphaea thermarum]|nr:Serine/threonine-phosphatase BSL1-like protein [Nymphaea thermarum]
MAKCQILTGSDLSDLADTYNRLSRLAVTLSQITHDTLVSALVMSGGQGHSSFGGTRGRGTGRGAGHDRFQCSYCGKVGHLEDRCWDKHAHLRSSASSGRGGGRITTGKGPSSSQAAHSKTTISMVESSTDPSISMSYSLNLSKDEYDRVLAQRSASTSANTTPQSDAYGLLRHRDGKWEWTLAPGVPPSPRYQHAAVFLGNRLHVTGGTLKGGRTIEGEATIAVLDTAAGVWLDRNGIVTSSRSSKSSTEINPSLELLCRCRHAAACVGNRVFIYGGLKGDALLDDLLFAENSAIQTDEVVSFSGADRTTLPTKIGQTIMTESSYVETKPAALFETAISGASRTSLEKLVEASAAEAEAVSAVWEAAKAAALMNENHLLDGQLSPHHVKDVSQGSETSSEASDKDTLETDVRLHHRAIISLLLRPRNWMAPTKRNFFLDSYEVGELCYAAEQIFLQEPAVLQLKAPVKVFGDLHGQFGDLMRLFDEYGFPSTAGDITYIDYLFLGDYIEYPEHVHLIRGNHEAADINALFGFRLECIERMGENDGIWAWTQFNQVFNALPLCALIEKKIICMHGGIGRSINYVEQIEKLERPITMDSGSIVLMDLLWSDPTENDTVEGLRPNARGPGLVTFGPDRVIEFCKKNKLQLIIRAHECVMDGFERFAQGHLITLFSATNYCGTANNAGALLVIGRDLVVVPKLIHPLPPPFQSPESSPDRSRDMTWMQELNIQRPPTPTRGRPQSSNDRSSLAFI